jgi:hypothetical protein
VHALNGLASIGTNVLQVVLLLAIPIVIAEFGWFGLRRLAPGGYFQIPFLTGSAKLLGLAVGVLLLASRYDRHYFDLHDLFGPESPWNLSLVDFLTERVNPVNYWPGAFIAEFGSDQAGRPLLFGLASIAVLLVIVVAAPFAFWPPPAAARGVVCGLIIALIMAYLTLYLVCLLMWTLYLLNFWTFAVLAVVFQYYRYRT